MKMLFLLFAVFLAGTATCAQRDSSAVEKMGNVVAAAYRLTNPSTDFVGRFFHAYEALLRKDGPALPMIAAIEFERSIAPDSAIGIFMDSSLAAFKRQHLWEQNADLRPRLQSAMSAYMNVICPCMAERTKTTGLPLDVADATKCQALVMRDTALIQQIKTAGKGLPFKDQLRLNSVISQAMFEECRPFYDLVASSVKMHVVGDYVFEERSRFMHFIESITSLRKHKSPELAEVFPAYQKYVTDIDAMVKEQKADLVYLYDHLQKEKAGVAYRSAYAYRYLGDKVQVVGELVYSIRRHPVYEMLNYEFTPAKKMKNVASVTKLLGDNVPPPPPRMDELREVPPPPPPPPPKVKKGA